MDTQSTWWVKPITPIFQANYLQAPKIRACSLLGLSLNFIVSNTKWNVFSQSTGVSYLKTLICKLLLKIGLQSPIEKL